VLFGRDFCFLSLEEECEEVGVSVMHSQGMSREKETKMEWQGWGKQLAESALQASNRFLLLANSQMAMKPLLKEFTAELKKLTGCAAVGIRILDEMGNIPYIGYEGFSQRFYELESPLSLHTDQCMCINVIKGTADPKFPFYTEGGSFYMNGTTRFLATVSEEAKGATRNTCNQHGYESVALVPIRGGGRILGLIHVADAQENKVPLDLVEMLEGAGMQLGTAIQRVMMEEGLRKKTDDLGKRVKELNCLYAFSNLVERPDISLPEIFQGFVNIIPPGWQYPETTCVRLVLEDQIFKTANFMETIWKQSSPILVDGRHAGTLEVYYLEEKPECDEGPFLKEERNLIDALAGRLGKTIQRLWAEEALQKAYDGLERRVVERTQELRHLSSKLLKTQEEERKRIAGELHDSIGASLGAIKFKIENAIEQMEEGIATPGSLKDLIPTVQQAIEESRRIMADLRPSMLDDLGILPTINWYCREFQKTYSHIHIEKQIDIEEDNVPASLKTVIYRILQEALNNVAKHSKADLTHLSLMKTESRIELIIQDNGQGFDVKNILSVESYRRGLGLGSMKERTELSGGSFSIESIKGKGTVIRASWPIEQLSL